MPIRSCKSPLLYLWTLFAIITCTQLAAQTSAPSSEQSNQSLEEIEQRIQKTEQQVQALNDDIATSKKLRRQLEAAIQRTSANVGERKQRLKKLDADISQFNSQLNNLDTQLASASDDFAMHQNNLASALNLLQQIGAHSELKILLQHEDPAQAQRLQVYSEYFLAQQKLLIDAHVSYLSNLSAAREQALKNRNWLNHIRKKADSQRQGFESSLTQEQLKLTQTDQSLADKNRSLSELQADQQRLQGLMEELRATQLALSGYFESGKGQYMLPVQGQLKARFGDIKSVGKLRWDGWFIEAKAGSTVKAIADGEVIYANWLQGFGMLAILDHGDGYMSLYGRNRSITASIGDWVESGATIATVGDSEGPHTSGLYFEIRQNAKALDPKHWIVSAANL